MYTNISSNIRVIEPNEASLIIKEIIGNYITHEDIQVAKNIDCYDENYSNKNEPKIWWFKEIENLVNKFRTNNIVSEEQFDAHKKLVDVYFEKLYPVSSFPNEENLTDVIEVINNFIKELKSNYPNLV
jgi:hypothetical protein